MLRAIGIAFTFLTPFRLQISPEPDMSDVGKSAWAFPLVGAAIGLTLVLVWRLLTTYLPAPPAAILVVGLWVMLTGGLHLDGWADCWDALPASVLPEQRLEILKDSRIGTFGVLGLVLLLALKTAAVASDGFGLVGLFLAPVLGRGMMVICASGATHRGDGMAAQFITGLDRGSVTWAAVLGLGPAIVAGSMGLVAVVVGYLSAVLFRRFAESRLKTINGDMLGAVCELSEAVVLLVACIKW